MAAARSLIRIAVNVALDGGLAALSVPVARWLADPAAPALHPLWTIPLGAVCLLIAGIPFRLSLQFWRFAAIGDVLTVAASAAVGAALFAVTTALTIGAPANPAFPAILALTLLLFLGGPRVFYRWRRGRPLNKPAQFDAASILLVGSIEDADLFIRALAQDRRQTFRVEGLLASSERQTGRRIQGHRILGSLNDAAAVLEQLHAEGRLPGTLVFVTPELSGARLAQVVAQADRFGLQVRQAPRPTALADPDKPRPVELRPVAIEDLLNRKQVPLDRDGMARLIQGRRVIVTGAGGTIGSELARQVAAFGPGTLILLDNGEYALWQIDLELAETHPQVNRRTLIADIRDESRIRAIFEEHRPELVFHAAALKHVPMVEANPLEGMATNAAGTRHVADAARATGALAMVLISTDKAVNPTSVMGASKRLAEMYCQALDITARSAHQGHALHHRPVRQRARVQHRLRRAAVPAPVGARRPADRHPPRHAALFHDGAGGSGAGPAGQRAERQRRLVALRRERRHFRARHGRAGEDRRSRPADDPPRRVAAGAGHRNPLHRPAPRRKTV